jgi:uncharacterized protein
MLKPTHILPIAPTPTNRAFALDWTSGPLAEGLALYNSADFFHAHEAWESVWLTSPQPEKLFLQALIQTTVALHHFTRNNRLGCTRLLGAALRKLEPFPPDFSGIDVALLRDDIRSALPALSAAQTSLPTPPRIQVIVSS